MRPAGRTACLLAVLLGLACLAGRAAAMGRECRQLGGVGPRRTSRRRCRCLLATVLWGAPSAQTRKP